MRFYKARTSALLLCLILATSILISGCTTTPHINLVNSTPSEVALTEMPAPTSEIIAVPDTTENPTTIPAETPAITPSQPPSYSPNSPGDLGHLTVHFINVGQGDSILLKIGDKAMLIDGGPHAAGPTVASYLRSQGVNTIDVLVSTHPHEDHIGGLLTVLNEFPVKQVVDSGQTTSSQTYESYLTLIDQKNIPYRVGGRGQTIDLIPSLGIQILSPPSGSINNDDLNQNSIVLKVTHGNVKFLFMGDAGSDAENSIMSSSHDLKSDAFKVAHHGSKYASSSTFLSNVNPGISVIEVGHNSYGHPAPETLNRLAAIGSTVYRTDNNGNIVITSDGSTYTVSIQRGSAAQPVAPTLTISPTPAGTPLPDNGNAAYIGNSNTKKFHRSACRYVLQIAPDHIVNLSSKEEAISKGYEPCKVCKP